MDSKEELLEAFRQWRDDPVTKALFWLLDELVLDGEQQWSKGHFLGRDPVASAITQAEAIGRIKAYRWISDMSPADFVGAIEQAKER